MAELLLVRYGELALKSPPVRREFEATLRRNIVQQFVRASLDLRIRSDRGHLYAEVDDARRAVPLLRRVFGVTSVSPVTEVGAEPASIERALLELADPVLPPGTRFAVRTRRTGQHAFGSQELARRLGAAILARWPERSLVVDLTDPAVELSVEVRGPKAYLYLGRSAGPGGLPLGVAGTVVALVDGPRGALGAYLMMKRGCRCVVAASGEGLRLAREVLARFDPGARIETVGPERAESLRSLAESVRADGVVLPLTVEESAGAAGSFGDRVVFSPTVGFGEEEVARRWQGVEELAA